MCLSVYAMEQEIVKWIFLPLFTRLKVSVCVCGQLLISHGRSAYQFLESVTNWGPQPCDRGNQQHRACIIHEERNVEL